MSAQHAERLTYGDGPVPYVLTRRGEAATREVLTTAEAAALLGRSRSRIVQLASDGRVRGTKVNGRLLLNADSVRAFKPRVPGERTKVPADPFLRLLDTRGGAAACGVRQHSAEEKAIERARRSGVLSEPMADRLSVEVLGLTPWEVWGWPQPD